MWTVLVVLDIFVVLLVSKTIRNMVGLLCASVVALVYITAAIVMSFLPVILIVMIIYILWHFAMKSW